MSYADLVKDSLKIELNDFQRKAVNLLCKSQGCGPYDISKTFEKADWRFGTGIRFVLWRPRLSSYDGESLTRLVIGAHEECIRVEIRPVNFDYLAICMWPREREGSLPTRHPTIENAITTFRGQGEIEIITWHNANTTKPDPDISVLCCREEDFFCGYYDDELTAWISNESGGIIEGVTHWADPEGPSK
jgi:hypothetical protein